MKLKKEFIIYESDGEQIMVASAGEIFNGLVRSNPTAAFIVNCLREETTEDEIVRRMLEKYDATEEVIRADVARIIAQLSSIHALEEQKEEDIYAGRKDPDRKGGRAAERQERKRNGKKRFF
ncbi:MAG: PqqD family protein [Lachnospiraceae bacterium]|nr:PqqD family protein [Lachnospiraceae bacterium]